MSKEPRRLVFVIISTRSPRLIEKGLRRPWLEAQPGDPFAMFSKVGKEFDRLRSHLADIRNGLKFIPNGEFVSMIRMEFVAGNIRDPIRFRQHFSAEKPEVSGCRGLLERNSRKMRGIRPDAIFAPQAVSA